MEEENKKEQKTKNNHTLYYIIAILVMLVLIVVASVFMVKNGTEKKENTIAYTDLIKQIDEGKSEKVGMIEKWR